MISDQFNIPSGPVLGVHLTLSILRWLNPRVSVGGYAGSLNNRRRNTCCVPDCPPRSLLPGVLPTASARWNRHQLAANVSVPADFRGGDEVAEETPSDLSDQLSVRSYPYPVGYEPEQIRAAYGINDLHIGSERAYGAGQTIAIVDAYNDPRIFDDVNAFDEQFAAMSTGPTLFKQFRPSRFFLKVVNQYGQEINPVKASLPPTDPNGPGATKS